MDVAVGRDGAPGLLAPLLPSSSGLWLGRAGGDDGVVPGRLDGRGDDPWKERNYRNTLLLLLLLLL